MLTCPIFCYIFKMYIFKSGKHNDYKIDFRPSAAALHSEAQPGTTPQRQQPVPVRLKIVTLHRTYTWNPTAFGCLLALR